MLAGPRAVPYQAETLEGEIFIDVADKARTAANQTRMTAGGDDAGIGAKFADQALHHAVNGADGSVVEAGLHAGDRVAADDAGGLAEIDQGEPGGAAEEGFGGNADPGGDDASEIFRIGGNGI